MLSELFSSLLEDISEGLLLLSSNGNVVALNKQASKVLELNKDLAIGNPLNSLVANDSSKLDAYLRMCQRSTGEITGKLVTANEKINIRVFGRRETSFSTEHQTYILLRIPPSEPTVDRFAALNKSIESLNREIALRRNTEAHLCEQRDLAEFGNKIGMALVQTATLDETLQSCTAMLVKYLGGAFARIWVACPESEELVLRASAGIYEHLDGAHSRIKFGQFKIGTIAKNQTPHLTNNVIGDHLVHNQVWARREHMVAFAGYPLIVDNRTVGVMAMFSRHELSQEILTAMGTVANSIAIGIERKLNEQRLIEAKDRALAASASKSLFVANISHELRTPMTAILGFAEMLLQDAHSSEVREKLETIQRNGKYLLSILNDLLDLSKAESGALEVSCKRINLGALMEDLQSAMNVRAASEGIPLHFDWGPRVPKHVVADRIRLRQVLINLIGNALKFTDEGEVRVHTFLKSQGSSEYIAFAVRDTGIGIPAEKLPSLFKPFSQVATSSQHLQGTGLGLSISKRLAEAMGGHIQVESKLGTGSCFTLLLPLTADEVQDTWRPSQETASYKRSRDERESWPNIKAKVLVADDRRDIWRVCKYFLEKCGAEVSIAEDGRQAIDMAQAAKADKTPFDIIIMDMQMPIMNGREAVCILRQQGFTIPIIALTADAVKGERDACLAIGCTDYLAKPVNGSNLAKTVAKLVSGTSSTLNNQA